MSPYKHIAFYRFVRLDGSYAPQTLRPQLRALAQTHDLCGSVILAPEGINGFLAGKPIEVDAFWDTLCKITPFEGLDYKSSFCETPPFPRLKVKLKAEIIPMRRPDIQPELKTGQRITPIELKQWLDEGRKITLIDTRNDYEILYGTFRAAKNLNIKKFQDFADAFKHSKYSNPNNQSNPIVMFCTGGIRCEKTTALALSMGVPNVFQLDGGILRYFEQCGQAHYRGNCFVFDRRRKITPQIEEEKTNSPQLESK